MDIVSAREKVLFSLSAVLFRIALAAAGISCTFLAGSFLVSRLIVHRYKLPEHDLPGSSHLSVTGNSPESFDKSSGISSHVRALSPLHNRILCSKRSTVSLPETDDYPFDRLLFYKNLNNSSQFLRRDSFVD